MNITLYFKGLGYLNILQAKVILLNKNREIIYSDYTYNGRINLCLEVNQVYRLIATSGSEIIIKNIYIDSCHKKYLFYFPRSITIDHNITFLLTDSYYKNLPIERGEMSFG